MCVAPNLVQMGCLKISLEKVKIVHWATPHPSLSALWQPAEREQTPLFLRNARAPTSTEIVGLFKSEEIPHISGFFSFTQRCRDTQTFHSQCSKSNIFSTIKSNNLKKELEMNWSDGRVQWCSNSVYLAVCSAAQVLWCLGRSGMLFSTACMSWHILMLSCLLVLLLQDRCVCLLSHVGGSWTWIYLAQGKGGKKQKEESSGDIQLEMVHHRWLLFRIPGSWSHAALSLYLM